MINDIINADKEFSESTFLSNVDHIFIMLLSAIENNDIESVKHYLANDIYVRYKEMCDEYKSKGVKRLFDEKNVKTSRITGSMITDYFMTIDVTLVARYMDYFVDEKNRYVSGENIKRIQKTYKLSLTKMRKHKNLGEIRHCPYCGNSLDLNNSGVCDYCRKSFNMEDFGYLVTYLSEV